VKVEVHLLFPFREELPEHPVHLDVPQGADVARALAALVARHPGLRERLYDAQGKIARHVAALVNGVAVQYKDGLRTPLADGDVLTLLPPLGGG